MTGATLADETTRTPARSALRRALPWVGLGLVVIVVATATALLALPEQERPPALSASSAQPDGAMAVAEVLRQQGVEVIETSSLVDTEHAAENRDRTTVLLFDPDFILDTEQHDRLLAVANRLVVVEPSGSELSDLAPGVITAGWIDGSYHADCEVAAVQKAGTVTAPASAYRLTLADDGTACLTVAGDLSALVQVETVGTNVTVLGAGSALRNDRVADAGNAALALNLLGETETLIWYLPSADDWYEGSAATLVDLQAPWTVPLTVLLALVAFTAIAWKWRRFGPLVVENLPVIVRASETLEGRARLYERGSARLHALDALRIGTVARLARQLGLPRTASVEQVVDAVAALTSRPRPEISGLLVGDDPGGDAELVRLSDALLQLEADVAEATRPH